MSLPKAFTEMMQPLLGNEWTALRDAILDGTVNRGVRLHRLTQQKNLETRQQTDAIWALQSPWMPIPPKVSAELGDPVPWAEDGFYIPRDSRLGKTVYHEAGAFYIQEPSAMAVAAALQAHPGERVLDLCAAPGGKTTAIAKQMRGEGVLVANEIHATRVVTLSQNLERTGVPATVLNESPQRLAAVLPGFFDAVLVDAPCSGEGMFRKDPSARDVWQADAPQTCAERQKDILRCAADLTRNGGRIVYSTCTFNPLENESVVQWALHHLPLTLKALPEWPGWESGRPDWAGDDVRLLGTRRLWPHRALGEGHFVALFEVDRPERVTSPSPVRRETSPLSGWAGWLESILVPPFPHIWTSPFVQGEHVFAAAAENIAGKKLRMLRPGPCLAIRHQNRYEPHHSLAMAAAPDRVRTNLHVSEAVAAQVLAGQALPNEEGFQGYIRFVCDGLPLAWGKAVPGRINNLLPKGLRKTDLVVLSPGD